jgi:PLP dependent protein
MTGIRERLSEVLQRIRDAAGNRDNVKLIAVSKTQPTDWVLEAFQAGQIRFGENRVQEARDKAPLLPSKIDWHLIGPLQRNKAKYCPGLFSTIHTLHRADVATALDDRCRSRNQRLDVLIQMNLTGEDTKSGVTTIDELRHLEDHLLTLQYLRLTGLMTIGDPNADEAANRKLFARLYEINQKEADRLGLKDQMVELSTGMSDDFEAAIQEGATYVRIGSAIFGART